MCVVHRKMHNYAVIPDIRKKKVKRPQSSDTSSDDLFTDGDSVSYLSKQESKADPSFEFSPDRGRSSSPEMDVSTKELSGCESESSPTIEISEDMHTGE